MAKEKLTLTKEEVSKIKSYPTVARRISVERLWQGCSYQKLKKEMYMVVLLERNLKERWYKTLLEQMDDKRFPGQAASIYKSLLSTKSAQLNLDAFRGKCQRVLAHGDDKWVTVFYRMISNYLKKVTKYNRDAYEMLSNGDDITKVMDAFQERDRLEALDDEHRLRTLQTLKHIAVIRKFGEKPTYYDLELALKPQYADYREIYEEQVECVMGTFQEAEDENARGKVKNLCYDFIEHSSTMYEILDGRLVNFLFLGNWISARTYELLDGMQKIIHKNGMDALIFREIRKMQANRSRNKEVIDTDRYLAGLEKKFFVKELSELV